MVGIETLVIAAIFVSVCNLFAVLRTTMVIEEMRRELYFATIPEEEPEEDAGPERNFTVAEPIKKRKPVAMSEAKAYRLEQEEQEKEALRMRSPTL